MSKPLFTREWANAASGANLIEPDNTKQDDGWQAGEKPPNHSFNWFWNKICKAFNVLNSQGVFEWDAATTYPIDAVVYHSGKMYVSNTGSNINNTPGASSLYWQQVRVPNVYVGTSTPTNGQVGNLWHDTANGILMVCTVAAPTNTWVPTSTAAVAASTSVSGIIQLATNAEVQTGTNNTKAVTPAGLASRTATTTRTGLVRAATDLEATAGVATDCFITPAQLVAFIDTNNVGAIIGEVRDFSFPVAPDKWLEANGAVITTPASISDPYYNLYKKYFIDTGYVLETVTVNATTERWTKVAHGLETGDVLRLCSSGAFPTASATLNNTTDFFVFKYNADEFYLCTTIENAWAGTYITITSIAGIGTLKYLKSLYGINGALDYATGTFPGWKLPDYRGGARRSWDHGRGVDANRGFGNRQTDLQKYFPNAYNPGFSPYRGDGNVGGWIYGNTLTYAETRMVNNSVFTCVYAGE